MFQISKILKENEMVIKSGSIFQILFRKYFNIKRNYLLIQLFDENDIILKAFEDNLRKPNIILETVLLDFFENKWNKYFIK